MICVIDRAEKVVWGVGPTAAMAMAHAHKEASEKSFAVDTSEFEIAQLSDSADLNGCGHSLWQHVEVKPEGNAPLQQGLF